MINELERIWEWSRPDLKYQGSLLSQHLPRGTEENYENLGKDSQSLDWDLHLGSPEYEAGVLAIQPWWMVTT
jgi:hypothetical protein